MTHKATFEFYHKTNGVKLEKEIKLKPEAAMPGSERHKVT
jgi:hypothetical protein